MDQSDERTFGHGLESLKGYFEEIVDRALQNQKITVDDHTRSYLTNLLIAHADSGMLVDDNQQNLLREPVALLMARAMEAPPQLRFRLLRQLGDLTLYLTGFFAARLEAHVMDAEYYIAMGGGAYLGAARTLDRGAASLENPFRRLFEGLAERFGELVEVLAEVGERSFGRDRDILRLYRRFMATGNPRLAGRLTELGVLLPAGGRALN